MPIRLCLPSVVAWFMASVAGASAVSAAEQPNVLFILTDDQGYGDLSCAGHPYLQTPNLDRLASESTTIEQFYVGSAICSPSRAAFVTGRFPGEIGIRSALSVDPVRNAAGGSCDYLDPRHPSVMQAFQNAGYRTGHIGKWHMGQTADAPPPEAYGLDFVRAMKCNGSTLRVSTPELSSDYKTSFFRSLTTSQIVDDAIAFMEADDRPFYLNVWTLIPHAKLNPTPEELSKYEGLRVRLRDFGSHFRSYLRQSDRRDEQMQTYCAAVTGLDAEVGRLLDALDRLGLADRTIVVFASDNGPESYTTSAAAHSAAGSPGILRGRKRSLHEGGIRVPFMVRWPGRIAPGIVDATSVVGAVDFFPTMCSLAGIPAPDAALLNGEDVSDILLGAPRARRRPLLWESRQSGSGSLAMRHGRWKLLVNDDGSSSLYRIDRDPRENRDLASVRPWIATRLRSRLDRWASRLPEPTDGLPIAEAMAN